MIKKVLLSATLILLIPQISLWVEDLSQWTCTKRSFLVSAYYSPIPNQRMYIRWSLEKDIILNWRWANWADWTEVYMWLLAAPKWYNFWSKIILPWLWVWTVHDRWGAIVAKSWYDRIDVWMWKWDEWLSRALNWWMRFIEWERCTKEIALKDTLDYFTISSKLPSSVEQRLVAKSKWSYVQYVKEDQANYKKEEAELFEFLNFTEKLQMWNSWPNVVRLQMILQNIGFYNHTVITWIYDINTMEAIFQFQRENGIILWDQSVWAWYFWEKTSKALDDYLVGLHSTIKDIWYSKAWNLIWDPDYNDEVTLEVTDVSLTDISVLPVKKADLMILDQAKTVAQIQEILKNNWDVNSRNSSIIAWSDIQDIWTTKEQVMP